MESMRIGYIAETDNPEARWKFREAPYTRTINSRGDRIRSKMLLCAVDYDDVASTTAMIKERGIIIVRDPFFLDDELREKVTKWVEWANQADPKEYDPFA
ncbi:MAG: hypothetical protein LUE86_00520 [Clostridiales bacterium]|nr:hypothetical protein [Clostridiales bacterium]